MVPSCTQTPQGTTIDVNARLCGVFWQGAVDYTLTPTSGSAIKGSVVSAGFSNVTPGTWTFAYVSGGPGNSHYANVTPSATQNVSANGTITFTLHFELDSGCPH